MGIRRIFKYDIPYEPIGDEFTLHLPEGSQFVSMAIQHGAPKLWMLVDPTAHEVPFRFRIAGTGHPIDSPLAIALGSFQLFGGDLVFHLLRLMP